MEPSDEELIASAIAVADHGAFSELVRRHQGRVRGWLRQLSGDAMRADDLAQDTFIRAWEKLETYSGKGKFSSWLMKIAYNVFLQAGRGTQRERRLADAVQIEQTVSMAAGEFVPDAEYPDLPKMLAILSPDERIAMILCYAYGCSHGEASEVTGMPLGTIKSHVKRGKEKIRRQFRIGRQDHD